MSASEYPLQWPEQLPRSQEVVQGKFKTTLNAALKNVRDALRRFGDDTEHPVEGVVISSNVSLGNSRPEDPAVSVWFMWDGAQRCIAVDRYAKAEGNLQAIFHILEARRTEMRHGGLNIVRAAFKGFDALPSPESDTWWGVLGVRKDASNPAVREAWKRKLKESHPDRGGSDSAAAAINGAYDKFKKERGID